MAGPHGCTGTTRKGNPCGAHPLKGRETCISHSGREIQESVGFGGRQPGAGRPPNPRAVDVLRERIEANIDRWLAPVEDALGAGRDVIVGTDDDGEPIYERAPDHMIRLKAFAEAFDRAFGKPRQSTELTGADGAPIQVEGVDVSKLSDGELTQLRELLARARPVA